MQLTAWLPFAIVLLACILFIHWQLIIAEGVYLGPRVVRLLYDRIARRYNDIKCFEDSDESWHLGAPLARALQNVPAPLVLDVACGTGRLPKTLLEQDGFTGKIIGLDASRKMLVEAACALDSHVPLIWQDAERLPFEASTFDAVTCLEALEFMPNTSRALAEIARVLRPGGILLTSNRIGAWAKMMPGHTMNTQTLEQLLESLGFEHIKTLVWQVEYNLVWAVRSGIGSGGGARTLSSIFVCPHCHEHLTRVTNAWQCEACTRIFPVSTDGIIEMLEH